MAELVIEDARDLILQHLRERGIKQSWLASKLGLSNSHLTLTFQKQRDLTKENLKKINSLLGTHFKQ